MRKTSRLLLIAMILVFLLAAGGAGETLRYGMEGEDVARLQLALIETGYLKGEADGVFGTRTENAVRAFQKKNRLKVDGKAGEKTQQALYSDAAKPKSDGFFGNDYTTITAASEVKRIKLLQKALIRMNYLGGSADGVYGSMTLKAVVSFQREHQLEADGVAGKQTLKAMEKAITEGYKHVSATEEAEPLQAEEGKIAAPDKSSIQLLHWYKDIKPKLKSRAKLVIYDPKTGLSWTLMVHSKGRHCDAEPLTLKDTQIMMKSFGNRNTWGPRSVYVQLPDGRWTIGATHNVPHLNGYLKDNGFDGVVCVHFYRDMEECMEKDPDYGVQNQKKIRATWELISGEKMEDY